MEKPKRFGELVVELKGLGFSAGSMVSANKAEGIALSDQPCVACSNVADFVSAQAGSAVADALYELEERFREDLCAREGKVVEMARACVAYALDLSDAAFANGIDGPPMLRDRNSAYREVYRTAVLPALLRCASALVVGELMDPKSAGRAALKAVGELVGEDCWGRLAPSAFSFHCAQLLREDCEPEVYGNVSLVGPMLGREITDICFHAGILSELCAQCGDFKIGRAQLDVAVENVDRGFIGENGRMSKAQKQVSEALGELFSLAERREIDPGSAARKAAGCGSL